jgi:two-component system NarL family sensor kinase
MALTLPGLAACFISFAFMSHDRLFEPLALLLAGCTVVGVVAYIDLDDRLLIDASFVPSMLAIGFLGPAPAFAMVIVGEAVVWLFRPFRLIAVPINAFSLGAPALAAALFFQALDPSGVAFFLVLGLCGLGALVLNDLLLTSLIGVLDDAPIASRLREHLRLAPAIAINVLLGLATAALYEHTGITSIAVVLLAMTAFNYMVTQVLKAQRLASSSQRLVADVLDAEERERRNLSERLHDEAIQNLLIARQDVADAERGESSGFARARLALDRAVAELRGAVIELHPVVLEQRGLGLTLDAIARRQGRLGKFAVSLDVDPQAEGVRDRLLLAIGRELLTNVAKHARARHAELQIARRNGHIVVDIRDDGRGFQSHFAKAAVASGHIGLASLTERVAAVGGSLDISSTPGRGAHIRVVLPAEEPRLRY